MAKWDVEPDVDNRFAFLTYREEDRKQTLLQIPFTSPPWNDAYIHMSRLSAEHLKTFIEKIVNENQSLRDNLSRLTKRGGEPMSEVVNEPKPEEAEEGEEDEGEEDEESEESEAEEK